MGKREAAREKKPQKGQSQLNSIRNRHLVTCQLNSPKKSILASVGKRKMKKRRSREDQKEMLVSSCSKERIQTNQNII